MAAATKTLRQAETLVQKNPFGFELARYSILSRRRTEEYKDEFIGDCKAHFERFHITVSNSEHPYKTYILKISVTKRCYEDSVKANKIKIMLKVEKGKNNEKGKFASPEYEKSSILKREMGPGYYYEINDRPIQVYEGIANILDLFVSKFESTCGGFEEKRKRLKKEAEELGKEKSDEKYNEMERKALEEMERKTIGECNNVRIYVEESEEILKVIKRTRNIMIYNPTAESVINSYLDTDYRALIRADPTPEALL